jgi:hypothetical protein
MNNSLLSTVNHEVYRRHPEFQGVHPKVKEQGDSKASQPNFLLTYQRKAQLEDGKSITRYLRVVVSSQGKIIKITTSR